MQLLWKPAKYILTHPEQYILPIREWQRETASLIDRLNELGDLEALPTSVTFFLVRLKKGTAAGVLETVSVGSSWSADPRRLQFPQPG